MLSNRYQSEGWGGQDFEKPSLNITKKRYHKIRMYNNVKSWLYYPHDNTCCTKNWIVTPVLRDHLWNKQTKTDALFVWHASFSFIGWPSTISHLFSDIFFYYILTVVFVMTDCNIFTLYLYQWTFMDEWFLVIIQVWFLLWKFHDYWRGKKSIILIINYITRVRNNRNFIKWNIIKHSLRN